MSSVVGTTWVEWCPLHPPCNAHDIGHVTGAAPPHTPCNRHNTLNVITALGKPIETDFRMRKSGAWLVTTLRPEMFARGGKGSWWAFLVGSRFPDSQCLRHLGLWLRVGGMCVIQNNGPIRSVRLTTSYRFFFTPDVSPGPGSSGLVVIIYSFHSVGDSRHLTKLRSPLVRNSNSLRSKKSK